MPAVHVMIAGAVVLAGWSFESAPQNGPSLPVTCGLVFGAEMFNTVIEMGVDLLTRRQHPMAKAAKDVAAGAVLVTAIAAVAVGGVSLGRACGRCSFDTNCGIQRVIQSVPPSGTS